MMDTKLAQSLEQLHAELEQTKSIDPATRELLQHLAVDLQSILQDRNAVPPHRYNALSQRLNELIQRLEGSHPNLVLILGQVIDHLAQV
jgi:tRNA C32,U32 (ribose-2'-O)-methylase TrmJ